MAAMRFGGVRKRQGLWAITAALASVGAFLLSGCADHRISLAEFLDRERAAAEARRRKAEAAPPVDLDRYLAPYQVGPGDVLTVAMVGADGAPLFPPLAVRVNRAGQIDLPLVGKLEVADREPADVEQIIVDAYVPDVYRAAVCHVELLSEETTDVLVIGAALTPGLVPLRRTQRNLLYAIVGAGGVTQEASGEVTLRRIRHPSEEVTLDLKDPVQLRAALALAPLERGDIVQVRAAVPNTIFVGGLVNQPGPQAYPAGTKITVLQALAAARGLRTSVTPKEGTLIRRMPDGSDAHVKLDLEKLATGRQPNFLLAAGDILWVPETWETKVQEFINRNVFLRGGASVTYNLTGFDTFGGSGAFGGGRTLEDTFNPLGFLGAPTPTGIPGFKSRLPARP